MEILKVSKDSKPASVAGAIANSFRSGSDAVELQAIGAGAVNQATKSVIVARGYLAPIGIDLVCRPAFAVTEIDGENRTAIRLICTSK